jgi:hypothetical protein
MKKMFIFYLIFILLTVVNSAPATSKTTKLNKIKTTVKRNTKSTIITRPKTTTRTTTTTTVPTTTTTKELDNLITTTFHQKLQLGYVRMKLEREKLSDGSYGLKMAKL